MRGLFADTSLYNVLTLQKIIITDVTHEKAIVHEKHERHEK